MVLEITWGGMFSFVTHATLTPAAYISAGWHLNLSLFLWPSYGYLKMAYQATTANFTIYVLFAKNMSVGILVCNSLDIKGLL